MLSRRQGKSVVGLDLDTGSVAAAELRSNGATELTGMAVTPLVAGAIREGEVTDADALGDAIRGLLADRNLQGPVRVGIANQRVAVRTLRLPPIQDPAELETAVRFLAQDHIPMPLEHAVLDYQVVDRVTTEDGDRIEVVAAAARRDMVERLLEALRRAGVRPLGIDLSAFGMIRALAGDDGRAAAAGDGAPESGKATRVEARESQPQPRAASGASLFCNFADVTNLAVARGRTCVFTRISPFGVEGIAQRVAERRRLDLEHARQWLTHVGLERPTDEIDGDPQIVAATREALTEGVSKLADELRLSLEFYASQPDAAPIEVAVACGPGSVIPGLVDALGDRLGHHFDVKLPAALAELDRAAAARLTVAYGLALEG